jgi:predicted amidohydrolase
MIHICASQYAIERLPDWKAYSLKVESLVSQVKQQGSQLLLLPEYAGIECATGNQNSDLALFKQIQEVLPRYLEFFSYLASHYQIYIQPGTIMVQASPNQFKNRAYFFAPNGRYEYQDKLHLVSNEKDDALLMNGTDQTLFHTPFGIIGIAICYDSEFPEIVRKLCLHGAMLILVPSYTPSKASFHRVFYSCRARAIENQCYVLMASAIGKTEFAASLENLTGQANLFTPIDDGFSDNGILAQGKLNEIENIFSTLDYHKLDQVRQHGQVLNFNDYRDQINNKQEHGIRVVSLGT